MYDDFETQTSYKYLQTVVKALPEPIAMLGGWAVYFQVNDRFREAQGRDYLGSRDIDLGFHIDPEWGPEELRNSALGQSLAILENTLGFKSVMFRLVKEIHCDTGKELEPGEQVFPHQRFQMSVDPIIDFAPKNFREIFRFQPMVVPLLAFAFKNQKYRDLVEGFDKKLLLPKSELLVATKLLSIGARDKRDKKVKDICDIFSLLWYGGDMPARIKLKVRQFLPDETIKKGFASITTEDLNNAAIPLHHDVEEIRKVLSF